MLCRHPALPVIHSLFSQIFSRNNDNWHRHIDTGHRDIVKIINLIIRREDFSGFVPAAFRKSERNRCGSTRYAVNSGALPSYSTTPFGVCISFDKRTRIDVADTYAGNWRSRCNQTIFNGECPNARQHIAAVRRGIDTLLMDDNEQTDKSTSARIAGAANNGDFTGQRLPPPIPSISRSLPEPIIAINILSRCV